MRADGGDDGPWSLRVASVCGVRHRLAGAGSDDAYGWRRVGDTMAVAVADGVGSVPGSAAAAGAAVDAALNAVAAGCDPVAALRAADGATRTTGGATTLVVATVDADGVVTAARVGDSTAFTLADGGWRELWSPEADPGTVGTATAALPATDARPEPAAAVMAPGWALVLVTDGVADPLRDGPTTVAPGLAARLADPPDPLALVAAVDFSRQGCHDDRTVLAVWLRLDP